MKKIFNNTLIKVVVNLLLLTLLAKFISVVALWLLPFQAVTPEIDNSKVITYHRVDFHNFIQKRERSQKSSSKERLSIDDMILYGLYGNSHFGYAIVAIKSAPDKTEIISIGEKYRGYKLKKIALHFVVFTKNRREYILALSDLKNIATKKSSLGSYSDDPQQNISISRNEIHFYEKNPSRIWQDISINEIKKSGKIVGFKVLKVRRNSKIGSLGLQRGDIILKANGIALRSYNAAFKIYSQINTLENLTLLIKRGNKEKELIYEIY
jgi:general secretion pathway protein C